VDEAIEECGRREARVCALPARVTLYFILALWFYPAAGYAEVLRMLFRQIRAQVVTGRWRIPSVSAVVQARRRLGPAPLKALLRSLGGTGTSAPLPGMTAFGRELALLKVSADGTRLDVADTAANRRAFGDPPQGGIGSGRYPQIRLLALIACGTRTLIDAVWGTLSIGEPILPDRLVYHGVFRRGMLVLADRYFSGHPQVARIAFTGADLIVRVKSCRRLPVLKEWCGPGTVRPAHRLPAGAARPGPGRRDAARPGAGRPRPDLLHRGPARLDPSHRRALQPAAAARSPRRDLGPAADRAPPALQAPRAERNRRLHQSLRTLPALTRGLQADNAHPEGLITG
jgi:Insertion element 4 transposase N-terminal